MLTYIGLDKKNSKVLLVDNTNLNLNVVTKEQFVNAIQNQQVINVGLKDGKIVGTNGALGNYGILGEKNVPVIVKVGTVRNSKRGRDEAFEYVISSTDGKIITYPKAKAIALFKKKGLANGRVVEKEGAVSYVSAIRNKYESYKVDGTVENKSKVKKPTIAFSVNRCDRTKEGVENKVKSYIKSKIKSDNSAFVKGIFLNTYESDKKGVMIEAITVEDYIPTRVGDLDIDFEATIAKNKNPYGDGISNVYVRDSGDLFDGVHYKYIKSIKGILAKREDVSGVLDLECIKSNLHFPFNYNFIVPPTLDKKTKKHRDIKKVVSEFKDSWGVFKLIYKIPLKNDINANDANIEKLLDILLFEDFTNMAFLGKENRPVGYLTHSEALSYVSSRLANHYNTPNTLTNKGIKVTKSLKNKDSWLVREPIDSILNFTISSSGFITSITINCNVVTNLNKGNCNILDEDNYTGEVYVLKGCNEKDEYEYDSYIESICFGLPFSLKYIYGDLFYSYEENRVCFNSNNVFLSKKNIFNCTKEGLDAMLKYYIEC